jgi:hypothetical protein
MSDIEVPGPGDDEVSDISQCVGNAANEITIAVLADYVAGDEPEVDVEQSDTPDP